MDRKHTLYSGVLAALGMLALILDPKTAVSGGFTGVEMCLKTVIPSLLPFFILSVILTGTVTGRKLGFMRSLCKRCGIPEGAESILLVGLLGGYPVGAQCVCQAYTDGQLDRRDARRMLGFCSNAGPAFLFGMVGPLFRSGAEPAMLWGIHIFSAMAVGFLMPGKRSVKSNAMSSSPLTMGQAMERSIRVMANVCGWVILFRVILAFLDRWFLWLLPDTGKILLCGILELTNGCLGLSGTESEYLRFVLSSVFLGFGGVCVAMQTVSITTQAGLGTGLYFPGKILQTCISAVLSLLAAPLLYADSKVEAWYFLIPAVIAAGVLLILKNEKINSSIPAASGV